MCVCVQAAQQGDSTKVDKRRKKKQKEQAEDEAFLDNGQDEDAEYQEGGSGTPLPQGLVYLVPCTSATHIGVSKSGSLLAANPVFSHCYS